MKRYVQLYKVIFPHSCGFLTIQTDLTLGQAQDLIAELTAKENTDKGYIIVEDKKVKK